MLIMYIKLLYLQKKPWSPGWKPCAWHIQPPQLLDVCRATLLLLR